MTSGRDVVDPLGIDLQHGGGEEDRVGLVVDAIGPGPELLEGEEVVVEGAATFGLSAGVFGVVVGVALENVQGDRGVLLHVAQHLGAGVDQGLDELVVHHPEGEGVQVGEGVLARILDAGLGHVVVVGEPEHTAGEGGRAAHGLGALEHGHLGAAVGGEDGGRRPARA